MRLLKKILFEVNQAVQVGKHFGLSLGIRTFLNKFLFRDYKIFKRYKDSYYEIIRSYLYDRYFNQVKYETMPREKQSIKFPIWVMWWQGEENMPEIVKICIHSIRENVGKHPVYIITEKNYLQYIMLPQFIQELVAKGIITFTHLSDIIRFTLLYEWGGVLA